MINEITVKTHDKAYTFIGKLLEQVEGSPYPDMDNYNDYEVYERYKDKYFVCVNYTNDEIKAVESEKQIVDFFGFDPIAKDLYERLGICISVEISTHADGDGDYIEMSGNNDKDYNFVGKLIHRSLMNSDNDIREIYKLNIGGYISGVLSSRGYSDVALLDELALIESVAQVGSWIRVFMNRL